MAKSKRKITYRIRFGSAAGFIASLASVYFLWQKPMLLTVVLLAISLATLWVYNFKLLRTYLFVAVMGPIAEIVAIHAGAWVYAEPFALGVPLWLFPLWGMAGLCFISVANYYQEIKVK